MVSDVVVDGGVDDTQLFDAMAHRRRRRIVSVLRDVESSLSLSDLAREVARREATDDGIGRRAEHVTVQETTEDRAEQLKITLHHRHLPKLANAGLVEYDADEKLVSRTSLSVEMGSMLDRLSDELTEPP